MFRNPSFCSFVSFLTVLVTLFNKILESSWAWTVFVMPFVSSFKIFKVVVREAYDEWWPELCIFFWMPALNVEATAAIPNETKIFFA